MTSEFETSQFPDEMVAQNRIKTALRNRLTTFRLNVLMTIDIEGPTLRKFDFNMAYKEWSNEKRRVKT